MNRAVSARAVAPADVLDDSAPRLVRSMGVRAIALVVGLALLALLALASLFVGSGDITIAQTWESLTGTGTSVTDVIVREFRVPRTVLGALVGAALGAAGALTQALTRNPLADPGLLGINSGAYLAVAVVMATVGLPATTGQVSWGLLGALVAAAIVYGIGSTGIDSKSPTKLVLAGLALGAVFNGVAYAVTLLNPEVFDRIRFWNAGSLQGRQIDVFWGVLPFIIAGLLIALLLCRSLNALALGDDMARALGSRVGTIRVVGFASITLLCGAATAAVGPISFLGLMVPHAVRLVVGSDQRWVVPLSMIGGPVIFLGADVLGRVLISTELPVGVVVAFLGAPVLIALVRGRKAKLA